MITNEELQQATDECMASLDALMCQPEVQAATGYIDRPILLHYGINEWAQCVGCGQLSKVTPVPGCPVHDPKGQA